ncbi:MAG: cation:proton antiporter [Actinomycetota bacterium]|nr:cation:proton antiporter [Actinomycetota bacterium]
MQDVEPFAVVLCVLALALIAAVFSNRLSDRIGVPTPAIFLVAAAGAAQLFHGLGTLSIRTDQRIVTVALVVILFDGGMHVGRARLRGSTAAVIWLGVAGTAVTAAALAGVAHVLFGFGWRPALLLGTALAPTDPAVVFSVLGRRQIEGRTATLLEGESGANDPVAIALMIAILGSGGTGLGAGAAGVGVFALQMGVGAAVGLLGGYALHQAMHRISLPNATLYPLQTLAGALLIYGVGGALNGSGFLAAFIAGIMVGDLRTPNAGEIKRFCGTLSSLGEVVAFTVLGLSVSLSSVLRDGRAWTGLALAALLVLVIRPLLVGAVISRIRLPRGERLFVLWAGLKGAVPMLLGTYVLTGDRHGVTVPGAERIYDIIFVVVTLSVVIQGGLVPVVARRLQVPMTDPTDPAPVDSAGDSDPTT